MIATLEKIREILQTYRRYNYLNEVPDIYRVFCFFDKDRLVVLINGFQKKSQKTPQIEITIAEKLKKNIFQKLLKLLLFLTIWINNMVKKAPKRERNMNSSLRLSK
ncbi:MAG: type II toxin-antitoxin system RelE/ParE family toxin [Bacteroidetes bacterium]|nr:type II toxin-antitoxin system RelE/ParE family toxin [Bacteroidota bacterium]